MVTSTAFDGCKPSFGILASASDASKGRIIARTIDSFGTGVYHRPRPGPRQTRLVLRRPRFDLTQLLHHPRSQPSAATRARPSVPLSRQACATKALAQALTTVRSAQTAMIAVSEAQLLKVLWP